MHRSSGPAHPDRVVVIGAGLAGLCAGIRLKAAGVEDFVILERADDVGGTWRDNRYPGVAVDVNSFLYSFSFEQRGWSRLFAPGAELHAYTRQLAAKYDLRRHIRFGADVAGTAFDERTDTWSVDLRDGDRETGRFLILATGMMSQPKWPAIKGLSSFEGEVLHTAAWDPEYDVSGRRVAVVGTGASAVQVIPAIAPLTEQLHVFQRTPIWILPKPDMSLPRPARLALDRVPPARSALRTLTGLAPDLLLQVGLYRDRELPAVTTGLERLALTQLRLQVHDPALRERLTPRYQFGCKRPGLSNDYLRAFNRDDVELVTSAITRVTRRGIRTADGELRKVDTIVLATGFKIFERGGVPPFDVRAASGRELRAFWDAERHQTSNGTTVAGFPNLFLLAGPYGLFSQSYLAMIEANVDIAVDCITEARRRAASRVTIRPDEHARQVAQIRSRMRSTSLFNRDCAQSNSYYFDRNGDAPMIRPVTHPEMWWRRRRARTDDYEFSGG
jgi:cation diffusion facilitator CzcD-associated flavoprotein CzcO